MPKINRGGKRTIAAMAVAKSKIAAAIKKNKRMGALDVNVLKKAFPSVRSGEVVLTPPQYSHIASKHPDALAVLLKHGKTIMSDPDYIIKDATAPNTVLVVKEIGKNYKTVVKLAMTGTDKTKKNSIITFHRISDRYLKNKLRKNTVLYEKKTK